MSTLAERLRSVIRPDAGMGDSEPSTGSGPSRAASRDEGPVVSGADVAVTLGGEWREAGGQRYLVVDREYAPGYRHGHVAVSDAAPDDSGVWPTLHLLAGAAWPPTGERLLFLDLETTGLAGGAGTYAFLVGCGWFDGPTFRVRQFFLSSFGSERVLLEGVAALAGQACAVVTYNGKSFDLPLIETRYLLQRMATPFAGLPHVDMLHPARRLWRSGDEAASGCRLSELELTLCGHERDGDVPGFEIPGRYFHYVRSGDARGLEVVLEHNRLDLLSLALVTARAAQVLDAGPAGARTAREGIGMGRLYERGGLAAQARAAYTRAADLPADAATRAEALRACAVLARRGRGYDEAASAWRRVLDVPDCPAPVAREAAEALAVHHEHRLRDFEVARRFALQSLRFHATATRAQAVRHRLARLDRKLGTVPSEAAVLF